MTRFISNLFIIDLLYYYSIYYIVISFSDALERERTSQHAQLRELVVRGDATALQQKLTDLGSAAGIVANLTPGGANTLLYV